MRPSKKRFLRFGGCAKQLSKISNLFFLYCLHFFTHSLTLTQNSKISSLAWARSLLSKLNTRRLRGLASEAPWLVSSKLKGQNHVGSFFFWVKVAPLWLTFFPSRIFLGSGLPLEGQLCSHGALRYQGAAGEMEVDNHGLRCREPTEQKACNLSMQLQTRMSGCLTPVKVKKAKAKSNSLDFFIFLCANSQNLFRFLCANSLDLLRFFSC